MSITLGVMLQLDRMPTVAVPPLASTSQPQVIDVQPVQDNVHFHETVKRAPLLLAESQKSARLLATYTFQGKQDQAPITGTRLDIVV